MAKHVVMVGLEPDVVDYSDPAYAAFPGLNAKILREVLERDRASLVAQGYVTIWSFWDNSEGAGTKFIDDLRTHKPDFGTAQSQPIVPVGERRWLIKQVANPKGV
jgi:hypothetical protein